MLSTTLWLFCLLNAPGILVHGYFTTNNYFIYFTFIKLLSIVRNVPCLMNDAFSNHYIKRFLPLFFCAFFGVVFSDIYTFLCQYLGVFSSFQLFLHLTLRPLHFLRKHAVDLGDCPINQYDNMLYNILKHCSRQF